MAGEALRIFISYARRDGAAFAEDLVSGLEVAGFEAFLDQHDIAAGEEWEARLGGLIQSADTVVFALTPAAAASERCAWEVKRAEALSKRIIPVVAIDVPEADVPLSLRKLNYVFFTRGKSFPKALFELVKALKTDLGWIREHTRLSELAERWAERGRPQALLLRGSELQGAQVWLAAWKPGAPEPTEAQRALIAESDAQESAAARALRTRQRRVVGALSAGLILLAGLAGAAVFNMWRAQQSSLQARQAESSAVQSRKQADAAKLNALRSLDAEKAAAASAELEKQHAVTAQALSDKNATLAQDEAAAARKSESEAVEAMRNAFLLAMEKGDGATKNSSSAGDLEIAISAYSTAKNILDGRPDGLGGNFDMRAQQKAVLQKLGYARLQLALGDQYQSCGASIVYASAAGGVASRQAALLADAQQEFQAASSFDPEDANARRGLGCALLALKQFPDAIAQFRFVLNKQRDLVSVLDLARAKMAANDWPGARATLQQAQAAIGDQRSYVLPLLQAEVETEGRTEASDLAQVGKPQAVKAIRYLDRALASQRTSRALLMRGSLYLQALQAAGATQAMQDFESAAVTNADDAEKAEAHYRLSLLRAQRAREGDKNATSKTAAADAYFEAEQAIMIEPQNERYRRQACAMAAEFGGGAGINGLVSCAGDLPSEPRSAAILRTGLFLLKRSYDVTGDNQTRLLGAGLDAFDRGLRDLKGDDAKFSGDLSLRAVLEAGRVFVRACAGLGLGDSVPTAPEIRNFYQQQGLDRCPPRRRSGGR